LFVNKNYCFKTKMATRPKAKRSAPLAVITAKERAKQYPGVFYEDGGIMFCLFCQHSVDHIRSDTCKGHTQSKKHQTNLLKNTNLKQVTIQTATASKDLRESFVLDFDKMCSIADIPLEKTEKMRGFLTKHCKQGGAVPQVSTLRQLYVPKLFKVHIDCLKALFDQATPSISVIADETTDDRDQSILNILAGFGGKFYLIDVVRLDKCNHATLSQSVIKAVSDMGINYDKIVAFVSDSAAYCKKAHREVLAPVFENSVHVLCLAHVLNLVGTIFMNWPDFGHMVTLVTMVKSAFFKKPGRKTRYLEYIKDYASDGEVKLPPIPVSTRLILYNYICV
jgi:hypothetical protein